jgi:hypothetical protein
VWALSLAGTPTWTQLTPSGAGPSARSCATAVYDVARKRMVVFGGSDPAFRNDAWALTLTDPPTWTQLLPSGTPPAGREAHSAIYDGARDRMVVFGGYDATYYYGDTWTLSFVDDSWRQLAPAGDAPLPRWGQVAVYDWLLDRMAMFGGSVGYLVNETWLLSWDQPVPVRFSLLSAEALPGMARIVWYGAGGETDAVAVERRPAGGDWGALASSSPDGTGRIIYEDRAVRQGMTYDYRLSAFLLGERESFGEVTLLIPVAPKLSVRALCRGGRLVLRCSLPEPVPATLQIVDVAGRRVVSREMTPGQPGESDLDLGEAALPSGVYLARLTQAGATASVRAVVTR